MTPPRARRYWLIACALFGGGPACHAFPSTKTYTGPDGNWNNPANWTPTGVPQIYDNVYINADGVARTVTCDVTGGTAFNLQLSTSNGASIRLVIPATTAPAITFSYFNLAANCSLEQNSGSVFFQVGEFSILANAYYLRGGLLYNNREEWIGAIGDQTFRHEGGDHAAPSIIMGATSDRTAVVRYDLSGAASLSVTDYLIVGDAATGVFEHRGGTALVGNTLYLGSPTDPRAPGHYNLSGGRLTTNVVEINKVSSFKQTGGTIDVGTVNQNGGAVTATNLTLAGDTHAISYYNLADGTIDATTEQLGGVLRRHYFKQTGGSNTAATLNLGALASGFTSTYTLADGSLNTTTEKHYRSTFTQTGGTHAVAGSLTIGFDVGDISIQPDPPVYIMSGGALSVGGSLHVATGGSTASFQQSGGTNAVTGTLFVKEGATSVGSYALTGGRLTAGAVVNNGTLQASAGAATLGMITGNGATSVSANAFVETAGIRQASLTLTGSGTGTNRGVKITPSQIAPTISKLSSLTFSGTPGFWQNRLDLTNNRLVLDYSGADSPMPTVLNQILTGRSGGTWKGNGITSSSIVPGTAIGYAESSAVFGRAGGSFGGLAVDGTAILVSYALMGDANLDGRVDFADLTAVAQNYEDPTALLVWSRGDFNYDGKVSFADLVAVAQHHDSALFDVPIPGASPDFARDLRAAFASVPEPAPLALLCGLACTPILRPGRRRPAICR